MSDQPSFRTPAEELHHLIEQIGEMRTVLREMTSRLGQIERHAKRAFQPPKAAAASPRPRGEVRAPRAPQPPPTLSSAAALELFDQLPGLLDSGGRKAVEGKLGSLELPDLKLLAQELGAPLPKKPSRKGLYSVIMGRVNESLLLSRNRNVTQPRSQGSEPPKDR